MHTTNAFLPLIRTGATKKVVLISTGAADVDFVLSTESTMTVPYAISKVAANMAFAKYAAQYKKEGLIFLSISPGFVNTMDVKPGKW